MGVQFLWVGDIPKRQKLQLLLAAAASGMNGEQNRPGNETAGEADIAQNLEVSKKEEAVQGAMVKNDGIGGLEEGYNPVEPTVGQRWDRKSACQKRISEEEKETHSGARRPGIQRGA